MLVGILKKLVGIMIGPVGILKNACRYFETVGIMNVGIMNVGIMNATPLTPPRPLIFVKSYCGFRDKIRQKWVCS